MMKRVFILGMTLIFLSGCVHAISRDVLRQVDKKITFSELIKDPNAYRGKVVLLGGVIVKAVNKKEGTLLEVYQTRLDREGRPVQLDISEGRFLALYKGLLDSEIYRKGRKVTIAGVVQGEKVLPLGEIEYHYPYLLIKEIHLWKEEKLPPCEPCLYPCYPWWWYPWCDPYWPYCRPYF